VLALATSSAATCVSMGKITVGLMDGWKRSRSHCCITSYVPSSIAARTFELKIDGFCIDDCVFITTTDRITANLGLLGTRL